MRVIVLFERVEVFFEERGFRFFWADTQIRFTQQTHTLTIGWRTVLSQTFLIGLEIRVLKCPHIVQTAIGLTGSDDVIGIFFCFSCVVFAQENFMIPTETRYWDKSVRWLYLVWFGRQNLPD